MRETLGAGTSGCAGSHQYFQPNPSRWSWLGRPLVCSMFGLSNALNGNLIPKSGKATSTGFPGSERRWSCVVGWGVYSQKNRGVFFFSFLLLLCLSIYEETYLALDWKISAPWWG